MDGAKGAAMNTATAPGPQRPDPRKLQKRLLRSVGEAIEDFGLIEEGDRLLVGLSGGKDSYALLDLLLVLQRRAPIRFTIEAANLDPGYADYRKDVVESFARERGVRMHMIKAPIKELIAKHLSPGQTACPLCSRMRRGALYTLANEAGCNKLALGHHFDDVAETLLMNLFYAGSMRAMPPKYVREQGPPILIRPLCYALERDIAAYAEALEFPTVPCASPSCGSDEQRRQVIKRLLASLELEHPDLKHQMRKALANVDPRFLFDRGLEKALACTSGPPQEF